MVGIVQCNRTDRPERRISLEVRECQKAIGIDMEVGLTLRKVPKRPVDPRASSA